MNFSLLTFLLCSALCYCRDIGIVLWHYYCENIYLNVLYSVADNMISYQSVFPQFDLCVHWVIANTIMWRSCFEFETKQCRGNIKVSVVWKYEFKLRSCLERKGNYSIMAPTPPMRPGDAVGFWGPPSSTLNWCETNYEVSYYIAEFWNTITNLSMIIPSIYGFIHCRRQGIEPKYTYNFLTSLLAIKFSTEYLVCLVLLH